MDANIFVGRNSIIVNSISYLNKLPKLAVSHPTRFLTLQGTGGIGKTKSLMKIREKLAFDANVGITEIIDLKATSNRSTISLMQKIITSLTIPVSLANPEGKRFVLFQRFLDAVKDYNTAREQEKYSFYETVVNVFVQDCVDFSQEFPFVIFLDTFESIQDFDLSDWLLTLLSRLGGRIGIVVAGRLPIALKDVQVLPLLLEGLIDTEIDQLGQQLFDNRGIGKDYDLTQDIIQRILHLTDGKPILVVLAFEWILENVQPEAIVSIEKQYFECEIVKYLKNLQKDEDIVVVMMATIDRRLNPYIMSLVTQWDVEKCIRITKNITRFSFVKTLENSDESENIITLHDEMLRLVNSYADFPEETKDTWRRNIVSLFYEKIIPEIGDPQTKQALIAEKLHYQLRCDLESAIHTFDLQMGIAVDNYEFEFCNLLLTEVNSREIALTSRQKNIIELCRAELLVRSYKPFEAKNILDHLITSFDIEADTSYFSRAISAYGACIANGATLVEANLTEAINLLKKGLTVCQDKELDDRVAAILTELGYCYDILGYNDETLKYFEESNRIARKLGDIRLVTNTLDEMGKLRLRRYEVKPALELFLESLEIKEKNNDTKGLGASYHYVGNAYRDLDNFPEALKWYELAKKARTQVADDLGLCELYSDITWLHVLEKHWELAIANLNKCYYEYAIPRHFGREIADAEHSFYHIKLEQEGLDSALPWIEKSFANAEKYSNTFIYLDAALHLIEAAYDKREYEKIPVYYQKMQELDNKGCGYRAFKGRAANILGDIAYDRSDFVTALDYWEEGYTIIAIHGRSRSSVKRFDDHFAERGTKLIKVLQYTETSRVERFLRNWQNTPLEVGATDILADEYPAMIGIVKLAMGDKYYEAKEFNQAVSSWYCGLFDLAIHITKKRTSESIHIDDYLVPLQSKLREINHFIDINHVYKLEIQDKGNWTFDRKELAQFVEILSHIRTTFTM